MNPRPDPNQTYPALDRAGLATVVADACVLRGTFTLRSGRTSSYYVDKYLFSTRPEVLWPLAIAFVEEIRSLGDEAGGQPTLLAGAELGGIPIVTACSIVSGLPCAFVRNAKKDYGTSKKLEGRIGEGDRVVFVEDVVTTGGQALEAVEDLKAQGAEVLGVVAAIDREEGGAEAFADAGVRFRSVLTTTSLGIEKT